MKHEALLWLLILVPAVTSALVLLLRSARTILDVMCVGVGVTVALGWYVAGKVLVSGPVSAGAEWLYLDALSAYNLGVLLLIYGLSSAYAAVYFRAELREGHLTLKQARLFGGLWCGALGAMTLVFISNNLGIMWVGIEATTLLTGFLICVHVTGESLEAMWKYILICSVGVAFAFMGTLLVCASTHGLGLRAPEVLLWTTLRAHATLLNPGCLKAAFIFLLVGYGTKAGLAPMHNWLPDAHSQAPAPVSALFSGFMLNTALYCVMRYVPIVEAGTGNTGWGLRLLTGFGLFSILVAAAFILFQHDLKRLLAYHSVEHIGIITLGVGLGGLGTFAALFHTLNHSLCKTLAFFAAGRLGQMFGTHDMRKLAGTMRAAPVWGMGLFGSLLALIGVAPFALFMSELQILKAAMDKGAILALVLFLLGAGVVFVGALGHAIPLAWGKTTSAVRPTRAGTLEVLLVVLPLVFLLVLGMWMPGPLQTALNAAADVIRHTDTAFANSSGGVMP